MVGLNLRGFSNLSDSVTSGSGSTTSFNMETAKTQHRKIKLRVTQTSLHRQKGTASVVLVLSNYLEKTLCGKFVCFPWEGRKEKPSTEVQLTSSLGNMIPSHEVSTQVDESCLSTSPRGLRDISNRLPWQPAQNLFYHCPPWAPFLTIDTRSFDPFCKYFLSKSSQLQQNPLSSCQLKGVFLPIKVCGLYRNIEVS